jgi:phosphatidylglycerol:prolipoprotein diacylglycerol transferase
MISINESTVLFKIGDFSVQTWGSIVAFGILAGLILFFIEAKKRKMYEKAEGMLAFMMIFGLVFGRLAYILVNLNQFPNLYSWFEVWQGGIISWGVLIGVMIGSLVFKWLSKIKFDELFSLIDMIAPYLILAIGIGRIGCFLRGCCFGIPSSLPWAVNYGQGAVHPTQIYHFLADMIIFFVLFKLYKKKEHLRQADKKSRFDFFNKAGSIFLMFLILFSVERFFIDFLRYHPANEYFSIFSITQWMFLAIFIVSFVLLRIKEKKKK